MTTAAEWVAGARPKTLPAAVAPVLAGTGAAAAEDGVVWWKAALCLVVSVALQVGVNYANDYSDGVRGTDADRVGPLRLVGSGVAAPVAVKRAALLSFAVAGVAGLALAATSSWWLLVIGAAAIASAWFYTGGPRPYGYAGLGEVFVLVFFGFVAVCGTTFVQLDRVSAASWWSGLGVGLLACAVLVVNNLRDIPTDRLAGKRTLAVRLGDRGTRILYSLLLAGAALVLVVLVVIDALWPPLALLGLPLAMMPTRTVLTGKTGRDLVPTLVVTGWVLLAYGGLLGLGLAVS